MIEGLPPYPAYHATPLDWLPHIPLGWELRRAKYFYREVDERSATGSEQLLSVSHKTGVTPRMQHVTMFMADSLVGYKICRPNDIAINTMWAFMGALGVARQIGLVSPSYGVYRPRKPARIHPTYLDRLLRTDGYKTEYIRRSTGINSSRLRLYPDEFLCVPILCPSPDEQSAIARFLSDADRRINQLIGNKQRLIELLSEQKHAVIAHAVTKGLKPNVPMKPSGIERIGDIPAHWELRRIKRVCRFAYGDSLPATLRQRGDVRVYGSNGPVDAHVEANTCAPCLVIGRKGSFGKVNYSDDPVFAIDTTYFVDERTTAENLRWLYYMLTWARLDDVTKDSAIPGLDRNEAYAEFVTYCSREEQASIAAYLDSELVELERAIETARREIDLIREYRTGLVADVVAGKLDVRTAAAGLPEAADSEPESLVDDDLEAVAEEVPIVAD